MSYNRVISLPRDKNSNSRLRRTLLSLGFLVTLLLGLILMSAVAYPRVQGYVAMKPQPELMADTFYPRDLLFFSKMRQISAQNLNSGEVIVYQRGEEVEYDIARVAEKLGTGAQTQFLVKFDANEQPEPEPVTLDMVRGKLEFKLPLLGAFHGPHMQAAAPFILIAVAQILLIYAGWYIGTSMINARDPQRQAHAARLRTAALAGNLETTRQRLRRQGLR